MIRNLLRLAAGFLFLVLTACAPTRDRVGLELRHGRVPDSARNMALRSDLGIQIRNLKGVPPLSGRLYAAVDSTGAFRFRLDFFGFPSMLAASWFHQERHWTLLMHSQREVWEGEGEALTFPPMVPGHPTLQLPSAEGLFGFLFGQPLVGFESRDSLVSRWSGDTLHWTHKGVLWAAKFDTTRGFCREVFSPSFRIRYAQPRQQGNRMVPREVDVEVEGRAALSLRVNGLEDVVAWKKNPFAFEIPTGYPVRRWEPK